MKRKNNWLIIVSVVLTVLNAKVSSVNAETKAMTGHSKPGLLIIAHGAPMPEWNKPVLDLEKQVLDLLGNENPFEKICVVMMEFAEPTIADGIVEMENAGCCRIIAVPLLIAPSSHSHWDIPALLGLYGDEEMEEELKAEGAAIVRSKLPITITPTLDHGTLIQDILLDRVKALSNDTNNEALVVLAHGDEVVPPAWNKLMKQTMTYICGKTGLSYADYAFVHVGQSYDTHGVGVIAEAAGHRKKVIVVGAYLSMGVDGMHKRFLKTFPMKAMAMPGLTNPLEKADIAFSTDGLLPDKRVAEWIVSAAKREAYAEK